MKLPIFSFAAALSLLGCTTPGQHSDEGPDTSIRDDQKRAQPVERVEAPNISYQAAFKAQDFDAVRQHIAAGTDVNQKGTFAGLTPLHRAAYYGLTDLVKLLLAHGADVHATEEVGWTPLHYAAAMSHPEIVELLLTEGADIDAKDNGGDTPLDAVLLGHDKKTADLLRKHGGKTN